VGVSKFSMPTSIIGMDELVKGAAGLPPAT
jgi:hypothetical protein